jgi:hypothetical protein
MVARLLSDLNAKAFPSWQALTDWQWQVACRGERPSFGRGWNRDATSRQAAEAAAEQLGIDPARGARKKEEINALASETGRPGFLKTLIRVK